MSKDYTLVFPISHECAHQVAMTAAEAAARIASPSTVDMDRLGEAVAKAYLQAYEAVEGWTKPQVPTVDTDADKAFRFAPRYVMSADDPLHPDYRKSRASPDYFTNQSASLQPKDA